MVTDPVALEASVAHLRECAHCQLWLQAALTEAESA